MECIWREGGGKEERRGRWLGRGDEREACMYLRVLLLPMSSVVCLCVKVRKARKQLNSREERLA